MELKMPEAGLYAGFAKVDITPDYQIGIGGYSNAESRRSEMVEERIYTTCIALSDGEETILLYTIDNCACDHGMAEKIRAAVTPVTGIAGEKIFCAATHGHNCPSFGGYPEAQQYVADFLEACVKAAIAALEDRSKAQLLAVKKGVYGMNFVRHAVLKDGRVLSPGVGATPDNPAVSYVTEPDRELQLLKFQREEFKKDILLMNWQGHPDQARMIGYNSICAGYPGPLRDILGALSGCLVAYFTGADGNTSYDSRVLTDKHGMSWRQYAGHMANIANDLLEKLEPVEGTGIATCRRMVEVQIDHSWDHMLPQANEIFDLWKATDKPTGDAAGKQYGFSSVYQARAIRSRAAKPLTEEMETRAFRIGPIGFTTGTYEMFSTHGLYVKRNSPFDITFLITANSGYLPEVPAYEYRSYEADTGMFAAGEAEVLAKNYVEMLQSIR